MAEASTISFTVGSWALCASSRGAGAWRMRRGVARLSVFWLGLVAAGCAQCGAHPERAAIEALAFGLQERSKPDGGSLSEVSGLRWDGAGVHASWEVETGMDWTTYAGWVSQRMPADFRPALDSVDRSSLLFRKSAPADFFVLHIEPVPAASPARVRIAFDGYPN